MRIPTGRRVSWVPEACSGPAKPAAATDYDTLPPVEPEQRREVNRIESRKLVRTWHRGNLVGVAWALQQSRRPSGYIVCNRALTRLLLGCRRQHTEHRPLRVRQNGRAPHRRTVERLDGDLPPH